MGFSMLLKGEVVMFKTYEELLKYINDYFSPGRLINESFFFYIHSVYTLDNPELFINQFSSALFYDTNWPHKGEIAEFLDSIPAGNTDKYES